MKSLFLFITLVFSMRSFSQADSTGVYTFCQVPPQFPGGDEALIKCLQQHITYPAMERDNNIQGKVMLKFVINEDGSVSNVIVKQSVSPGLDKEAVRVAKKLPNFTPGRQDGKAVKVYFNLPVVFKLQDNVQDRPFYKDKLKYDKDFADGLFYLKKREFKEALKLFDKSIKKFPKDYLGYQFRGDCQLKLHNTKAVCLDYNKAKELGSRDADEWLSKNCK